MSYAVELFLDAASETRVRGLWVAVAEVTGSTYLPLSRSRPHVSLAVMESLEDVDPGELLEAFAGAVSPFGVQLEAMGVFPGGGVVYLAPVVTRALLDVHEAFHCRLAEAGLSSTPDYCPGSWIPHCTVAVDLPAQHLGRAVETSWASGVFGEVQATEIGLVEFRPVKPLCVFPLAG